MRWLFTHQSTWSGKGVLCFPPGARSRNICHQCFVSDMQTQVPLKVDASVPSCCLLSRFNSWISCPIHHQSVKMRSPSSREGLPGKGAQLFVTTVSDIWQPFGIPSIAKVAYLLSIWVLETKTTHMRIQTPTANTHVSRSISISHHHARRHSQDPTNHIGSVSNLPTSQPMLQNPFLSNPIEIRIHPLCLLARAAAPSPLPPRHAP